MIGLLLLLSQDWPQFRGPDGQGHSDVKSLPLEWSETSGNIAWRAPIDGLGWSSPVIAEGRIWLTTATDGAKSLRAVCLDAATGKPIHDVEVFRRDAPGKVQAKNSHASPTPIIDGDRVYVHFGPYGTACLSREGKVLWKQEVRYNSVHGPGGSPALHGELLIANYDGSEAPAVIAFDAKGGTIRWKTARVENSYEKKFAFCTPLVITLNGAAQLVSPGAGGVSSYDPVTGKQVWHVKYVGGYSVVSRPVHGHGLVFLSTGFDKASLLAIRADGKGDVTDTHVAWRLDKGAPKTPSPLLVGDELYLVDDAGLGTCADARTGKVHWQERVGGQTSASPLHADGRVYFLDEKGAATVVKPGKSFTVLAKNQVKGRTYASLAPIEGALFLRTDTHLLRIEAK